MNTRIYKVTMYVTDTREQPIGDILHSLRTLPGTELFGSPWLEGICFASGDDFEKSPLNKRSATREATEEYFQSLVPQPVNM